MKTLILFSTRDGQTREIASFLASELKELGIDADTLNLNRTDVVEWHHYDRVVIGASIRDGTSARLVGREVTTIQSKGRTRRACADTEQTLVLVGGQIRSKGQTDTITRCR